MTRLLSFLVLFALISLNAQQAISQNNNIAHTSYTKKELVSFLDSVGSLDPDRWTKELSFLSDSTLESQLNLNRKLSSFELDRLKDAAENQEIEIGLAQQLFPEAVDSTLISYFTNGYLPIKLYAFSKDFNEYAILIGYEGAWENDIYFFKGNAIVAKHHIYHRYGFRPEHFKNENNETVVYYTVNYGSGSGIWWHQYNFYKYKNGQLIPVLTETQNVNLLFPWGLRAYWIKSDVISKLPLQLKFVYSNHFFDTEEYTEFINDSTTITYSIDKQSDKYVPNFSETKLNRNMLLSYYIADNDLHFMNTYYEQLKKELDGEKGQVILRYLSEVKRWLSKRSK